MGPDRFRTPSAMVKRIGSMKYDVAIVGAGVVGMATAFRLSERKPDLRIAVIDKEYRVAAHQTGRNSGVIHSGIYYKPGGSKARNCISGYRALLAFCDQYQVPHEITGKIIAATREQERPLLENIFQRGQANGLEGIRMLRPEEVREKEPHVQAVAGIWVPQTGIISYAALTEKYREIIESRGGKVLLGHALKGWKTYAGETALQTTQGEVQARLGINCAGLYADRIARLNGDSTPVRVIPFRGEYYVLRKDREYLVRNLIYPVPNPNFPFLGVHYTRMMRGGIEAGPSAVLAFRREGYTRWMANMPELAETLAWPGFRKLAAKYWRTGLDEFHRSFSKKAFVRALQHLIPEVGYDDLARGGAGVRAQCVDRDGNLVDEFLITEKPGIINVLNAPSPAATASLAIGAMVAEKALAQLNHV